MPPPSLSMTTMRTGVETSRRAARPPMSWSRPRSPVTIVVGRPLACGGADAGGDQAVDAVGAAVAEEEGVGRGRRQEGLLVADRHARGGVDEVAVAVGGAERQVQAGLGIVAGAVSSASIASRAARSASSHIAGAGRSSPPAAPPSRRPARSGRRAAAPPPGGSARSSRRSGSTTIWSAPRFAPARRAAACWSASRRSAGPGRARAVAEPLVAQQQVVGGDDVRAVVRAAAQLRGRLGQDRVAGGRGQVGERLAQLGVELAPGDDHAELRLGDVPATSSSRNVEGSMSIRRHRGQRPPVAPLERQRVGRASPRPRPATGASGSRQGEVEVDGPRPRLAARPRQSARQAIER